MNLIETDAFQEKKTAKMKKSLIIIVVLIIILLILAGVVWVFSQKVAKEQLKLTIDGVAKSVNSEIIFVKDEKIYTSIKDIAELIGYKQYNGEYKQYTEDLTKCYVTNTKELVTFASGSSEIRKYSLLDSQTDSQTFDIGEMVTSQGSKLYINQEGLKRAFNILISYTKSNNTVTIATLPYIASTYGTQITNSAVTSATCSFGESVLFNNQKALLYNYIIIKDPTTKLYGMASLNEPNTPIISARFSKIEFVEGINDFIVTTEDNKVGILGNDAVTKVKPTYEKIKEIDKDLGLYLVVSNNKQGVINQNGKIIVYQDYDQIGLDSSYSDTNIKNRYLIYDNCIPVKENEKWGLFDKNGNKILPLEYNQIGCTSVNTSDKNSKGIILIPTINAIVFGEDFTNESTGSKVRKYGLVNSAGEIMTQMVFDGAYETTIENNTTYYMTYQNQAIDIVSFWQEQIAKRQETTNNDENTTSSNSIAKNETYNVNNDLNSVSNNEIKSNVLQ